MSLLALFVFRINFGGRNLTPSASIRAGNSIDFPFMIPCHVTHALSFKTPVPGGNRRNRQQFLRKSPSGSAHGAFFTRSPLQNLDILGSPSPILRTQTASTFFLFRYFAEQEEVSEPFWEAVILLSPFSPVSFLSETSFFSFPT